MNRKLILVSLISILLLLLASCNDTEKETTTEERAVPVEITEAVLEDFVVEKNTTGRIEPKDLTPIMVQMPGELSELNVKNGDKVEKDELIAKVTTQRGILDVKAPEAGEIVELSAKENDFVSDSEPLALVLNTDELTITFEVTNHLRKLFDRDKTYKVKIDNREYEMVIDTIGKIPGETGLYPVEGTVKNEKDQVLPGMIGVLSLPEKRHEKVLVLPTEAIVEESEGSFVYRIKKDQAEKVEVTVIEAQSNVTAIEGDIAEDDQIVINGQLTLTDGSKVVIAKEENGS